MSTLHTAIALVEMNDVAVVIGQDLQGHKIALPTYTVVATRP